MAWSSAFRERATACVPRRSPSSRCAPCCRISASPPRTASPAKNVAAVMVTANLPPFASPGSRIDVNVSSLGDATSLRGGTLVMTSLSGADGEIYAVAQGSVVVSGFSAQGEAASGNARRHHLRPRAQRRDHRARTAGAFKDGFNLVLQLRNPDFSTAVRIADGHQRYARPVRRPCRRARGFAGSSSSRSRRWPIFPV
jgi:flagellar P-ring protein precursor FlgI